VLGAVVSGVLYTLVFVLGFQPTELSRGRVVAAVGLSAGMAALLFFAFVRWLHLDLYGGLLM
jgi:hypothetical protein